MRKKITIVICFIMLFCMIPVNVNAETQVWKTETNTVGDYEFVTEAEGCFITKYLGSESAVEIPEEIEGNAVIGISSSAFTGNKTVKSIVIPKTVKEIGSWAFVDAESLESISVDSKNESFSDKDGVLFNKDKTILIKYPSFKQDENYKIPSGVSEIAETAFYGAQALKSIDFCESLTKIARYAFYYSGIENAVIPNGVTEVGESAFLRCKSLQSITFPKGVETLCETVLADCDALLEIKLPENLKTIEACALMNCSALTEINLPNGVEKIEDYVFSGCTGITSLVFPDSVKTVGKLSMDLVLKFKEIYLGKNLTDIKAEYFKSCRDLERLMVSEENLNYKLKDDVLMTKDEKEIIFCAAIKSGEYIVPETVEKIADYAFYRSKLNRVVLSKSLKSIGDYAFSNSKLQDIVVNDGLTSIGNYAFGGCDFEEIRIPESITSIGDYAFYYCKNLIKAEIPTAITKLNEGIFSDCDSLVSVKLPENLKIVGNCAFTNCENLNDIQLPDTVTEIGDRAFEYTGITINTLPPKLRTIGERAFGKCFKMTEMTIPDSVVTIGAYAFANSRIEELTIGKNVEIIGACAFMSIPDSEIIIPANVRKIDAYAFGPIHAEKIVFEGEPPVDYADTFYDVWEEDTAEDGLVRYCPTIYYYEAYADEWEKVIKNSAYKFTQLDGGEKLLKKGDANKDYILNSRDIATLQKSILNGESLENADITDDGRINSLDIAAMQRAVHYGTQYYKVQEQKEDTAFIVSSSYYLYDKYKNNNFITVRSRDGFDFLPEKYDEEYFKENSLVLFTLMKDAYHINYIINIYTKESEIIADITKNILRFNGMEYNINSTYPCSMLVVELNQKEISKIEVIKNTGLYTIYPGIT